MPWLEYVVTVTGPSVDFLKNFLGARLTVERLEIKKKSLPTDQLLWLWNMHWAICNHQARLTQTSPIQIWLTYAPGLFGLLPDRAWIWLDFPTFEHDNLRKFTGLTCVLPAIVCGPVISRWLIPRDNDWSLFLENIKSFYFISFINPLYSYFVLNWLKKHEICCYDSDIYGKFLSFSYFIGYILNSLVQNQIW